MAYYPQQAASQYAQARSYRRGYVPTYGGYSAAPASSYGTYYPSYGQSAGYMSTGAYPSTFASSANTSYYGTPSTQSSFYGGTASGTVYQAPVPTSTVTSSTVSSVRSAPAPPRAAPAPSPAPPPAAAARGRSPAPASQTLTPSGDLMKDVVVALEKVKRQQATDVWVRPFSEVGTGSPHQFVFFMKPETTSEEGVRTDKILRLVKEALDDANIEIGGVRVLGGDYLENKDIMTKHYGVIAKISREGVSAISDDARANLDKHFGDLIAQGAEVLGGHQLLKKVPEMNGFGLSTLSDNLGTTRLAGGTYAIKAKINGKMYIVLNPFHAYQLVPYTTPGHAIIVFECRSDMSWKGLRTDVCGPTDPSKPPAGSIRNLLFVGKDSYGMKEVNSGSNGVHMSAGPLEGMVELQRFFSSEEKALSFGETSFGDILRRRGMQTSTVERLASNPTLSIKGKNVSAFDATEESDAADAADLLAAL